MYQTRNGTWLLTFTMNYVITICCPRRPGPGPPAQPAQTRPCARQGERGGPARVPFTGRIVRGVPGSRGGRSYCATWRGDCLGRAIATEWQSGGAARASPAHGCHDAAFLHTSPRPRTKPRKEGDDTNSHHRCTQTHTLTEWSIRCLTFKSTSKKMYYNYI